MERNVRFRDMSVTIGVRACMGSAGPDPRHLSVIQQNLRIPKNKHSSF